MKMINADQITTNMNGSTLEIFIDGNLAAEISDGKTELGFVYDVLQGMDYEINEDNFVLRAFNPVEELYTKPSSVLPSEISAASLPSTKISKVLPFILVVIWSAFIIFILYHLAISFDCFCRGMVKPYTAAISSPSRLVILVISALVALPS